MAEWLRTWVVNHEVVRVQSPRELVSWSGHLSLGGSQLWLIETFRLLSGRSGLGWCQVALVHGDIQVTVNSTNTSTNTNTNTNTSNTSKTSKHRNTVFYVRNDSFNVVSVHGRVFDSHAVID